MPTPLRAFILSSSSLLSWRAFCPAVSVAATAAFALLTCMVSSNQPLRTMASRSVPAGRSTPEQLSNKHFVLGTPLLPPFPDGFQTAVFATGCYWGAEKGFWRVPGVFSTAVGYAGGTTPNPTYEESCSALTGHTEAVHVVFDPSKLSYADLLRQFWQCHNPAQFEGQGGDHGPQYRSAVYTYDDNQMTLALSSKDAYQKALGKTIHTEILPMSKAGPFYFAHDAFQQYLARPGNRQYCSAEPQGVSLPPYDTWAPADLRTQQPNLAPKLPEAYWDQHAPKPHCVLREPHDQIKWP